MTKILSLYENCKNQLSRLDWLPLLMVRLSLASVFVVSGWGKLHNFPKVIGFFTQLGIPYPELNAHLVATTEFGCGMLLLIGLLTRLVSIPLVTTMVVAIITAKMSEVEGVADLFSLDEFVYIVLLLVLIFLGPGKLSVDYFLRKWLRK